MIAVVKKVASIIHGYHKDISYEDIISELWIIAEETNIFYKARNKKNPNGYIYRALYNRFINLLKNKLDNERLTGHLYGNRRNPSPWWISKRNDEFVEAADEGLPDGISVDKHSWDAEPEDWEFERRAKGGNKNEKI